MLLTVAVLITIVTPALAASWSMKMRYAVLDGKNNGQTYNLAAGTRTVVGDLREYYWNNSLTNNVDVGVVLYRSNPILLDTKVASTSVTVKKGGAISRVNLSATSQPKGTYYLYFHKANNETGVEGWGTIN